MGIAADDTALDERLTGLRRTNPAAFLEELFRAFYAPLGAVAYRVVPDRAVVEDILQDVFLRVWQGLDALPALASHRAYLTRMTLNAALRHRQHDQRQPGTTRPRPAAPPPPPTRWPPCTPPMPMPPPPWPSCRPSAGWCSN